MKKVYKQWEYRIEYSRGGDEFFKELREQLGPNGWELCGVVQSCKGPSDLSSNWPETVRYYFKREKQ